MKCPKYDTTIETNQTKIYKQNKTKQTNRCFAWKNKHTLRSFLYLVSFRKSFCLHKKNSENMKVCILLELAHPPPPPLLLLPSSPNLIRLNLCVAAVSHDICLGWMS